MMVYDQKIQSPEGSFLQHEHVCNSPVTPNTKTATRAASMDMEKRDSSNNNSTLKDTETDIMSSMRLVPVYCHSPEYQPTLNISSQTLLHSQTDSSKNDTTTPANASLCDVIPTELLLHIITLLASRQTTLYNLTLVSRRWNSLATKFLWKAPRFSKIHQVERFARTVESANSSLPIVHTDVISSTSVLLYQSSSNEGSSDHSKKLETKISNKRTTHFYPAYVESLGFQRLDEHSRNSSRLASLIDRIIRAAAFEASAVSLPALFPSLPLPRYNAQFSTPKVIVHRGKARHVIVDVDERTLSSSCMDDDTSSASMSVPGSPTMRTVQTDSESPGCSNSGSGKNILVTASSTALEPHSTLSAVVGRRRQNGLFLTPLTSSSSSSSSISQSVCAGSSSMSPPSPSHYIRNNLDLALSAALTNSNSPTGTTPTIVTSSPISMTGDESCSGATGDIAGTSSSSPPQPTAIVGTLGVPQPIFMGHRRKNNCGVSGTALTTGPSSSEPSKAAGGGGGSGSAGCGNGAVPTGCSSPNSTATTTTSESGKRFAKSHTHLPLTEGNHCDNHCASAVEDSGAETTVYTESRSPSSQKAVDEGIVVDSSPRSKSTNTGKLVAIGPSGKVVKSSGARSSNHSQLSLGLVQQPPPMVSVPRALRELDLGFCKGLSNYALQRLASKMSTLTALNLGGGGRSEIAMAKITQHAPNLTRLSLSWSQQLTQFGLSEIVQHCPKLRVLDLTHCTELENQAITRVAMHCRKLEVLSIAYCTALTDACVHELLESCGRLRILNMSGCMGMSREVKDYARERGIKVDPIGYLPFYDGADL